MRFYLLLTTVFVVLTDQGYDIIFETNGFIDYMEYPVSWQ